MSIIYTADREDTEFWRIERLQKLIRVFCQVFGISEEQAIYMIRSVHDHKGGLHVRWYCEPTDRQKQAIKDAWGLCGENIVHHSLANSKPLLNDCF